MYYKIARMVKRVFSIYGISTPIWRAIAFVTIIATSCANPMAPKGGIKDITPPQIVYESPLNGSVNFSANEIKIRFDEFIALKDLQKNLLISPTPEEKPDVFTRGKYLIVQFNEPLQQNTTYNIDFGQSITDLTEGNPLNNFRYAFSTGNVLDSLEIGGQVLNAFTLEPEKFCYVILYDTLFDSVPFLKKPTYITRTDNEGYYRLSNLKKNQYKIIALNDKNSDLLYNPQSEDIAFLDSLVSPWYIPEPIVPDSTVTDSTLVNIPRITPDSLNANNQQIALHLFTKPDSVQKLTEKKRIHDGLIQLTYKLPVKEYTIDVLSKPNDSITQSSITLQLPHGDTILCWFTNIDTDTASFRIIADTCLADTFQMAIKQRQKRHKKNATLPKLNIKGTATKSALEFPYQASLSFSDPLISSDTVKAQLITSSDTLPINVLCRDSLHMHWVIDHPWQADSSYKVEIIDSMFTSIYKHSHDTLRYRFTPRSLNSYGNLLLHISIPESNHPYIIQLLNDKDIVHSQQFINSAKAIEFAMLKPGKYHFRAIKDRNNNHLYDSGDYLKKIQPEAVFYLKKTIEIRANWDIEEYWEL